jgi:conjugative transfer signal peptidase TraF
MPKLIGSNVPATSASRAPSRRLLRLSLGVMGVWAILPTLFGHRVVVINTSPSVAPGLYVRCAVEPAVGRIVDFRIPDRAKRYVQGRTGQDGEDWYILKPIAAGPGDRMDTTGSSLVINGRAIAPMPPDFDSTGRPLPVWRENRVLRPDEFFVFSARIHNSFDSRCYGPIRRSQIESVRRPLLTW